MPTLTISKANPIHFRIETGVGTVNAGSDLPDNYLYGDIRTFFNCESLEVVDKVKSQLYQCDDTTDLQIYFDPTGDPGSVIFIDIRDGDGVLVGFIAPTKPFTGNGANYNNFLVDFSDADFTCEECHHLEIVSGKSFAGLGVNWGDNGTFENAGTWTNNWDANGNSRAHNGVVVQSGTRSAQITDATGSPVVGQGEPFESTSTTTLQKNKVYIISGYVYDDSGNPFTVDGNKLKWVVNGLTDYEIIEETEVIPSSAGRDQWHEIKCVFVTRQSTSCTFSIEHQDSNGNMVAPQANGIMYTDTHTLSEADKTIEATSESLLIKTTVGCSSLMQYYGDGPQLGLYYDEAEYSTRFKVREEINTLNFRFEDDDFDVYKDSGGTTTIKSAFPSKIYTVMVGVIAPYMVEIFALATLHDNLSIDGITYQRYDASFDPSWNNMGESASVEFDLILGGYDYQKSLCS